MDDAKTLGMLAEPRHPLALARMGVSIPLTLGQRRHALGQMLQLGANPTMCLLYDGTQLVGKLIGPPGTPYEGGLFCFTVTFPDDDPFSYHPPRIIFTTPIYHVNVKSDGHFRFDPQEDYGPIIIRLPHLLQWVQVMLRKPEPRPECWADDESMRVLNELARDDPETYEANARAHTERHAWMPLWSVATHHEHFPTSERSRVLFLLLVGRRIAERFPREEQAFADNWLQRVVPRVVGRAPIPPLLPEYLADAAAAHERKLRDMVARKGRIGYDFYNRVLRDYLDKLKSNIHVEGAWRTFRKIFGDAPGVELLSLPTSGRPVPLREDPATERWRWLDERTLRIEQVMGALGHAHVIVCSGLNYLPAQQQAVLQQAMQQAGNAATNEYLQLLVPDNVRQRQSACSLERITELLPAGSSVWPAVAAPCVREILCTLRDPPLGIVGHVTAEAGAGVERWFIRQSAVQMQAGADGFGEAVLMVGA